MTMSEVKFISSKLFSFICTNTGMREIVHFQVGQCGNQVSNICNW